MTDYTEVTCNEARVKLLYYVLLGRNPESSSLWLGALISEAARVIIASEEYNNIARDVLDLKFQQFASSENRDARVAIAKKLVRYGAPEPRTTKWYDLHLSALLLLRAIAADRDTIKVIDPIIDTIQSEFEAPLETDDVVEEVFQFDRDWFLSYHKQWMGLDRLSDVVLHRSAAQMALDGQAELSPFFSISGNANRELRQEVFGGLDATKPCLLNSVFRHMRLAAKTGKLTHWLFDEEYYLNERETFFSKFGSKHWEPLDQPYLDFIANGDRNGVRPHPLFCPASYKILNPEVSGERRPFAHYLRAGQFRKLNTRALFDSNFYQTLNPVVLMDVASGRFASAVESFCKEGIAINRPFSPDFDVSYYSANYDDVRELSQSGAGTAAWHFLTVGAGQGRRSNPYFDPQYYLERYPAAKLVCDALSIAPIEHFLMFGKNDGLLPGKPLIDREIDLFQAKALYERRALDSLIRLLRAPLDFTEFEGSDPILSIVVPVHNQDSFTARFLELAYHACAEMKRRTGGMTEIIIVSNGSIDQTNDLLDTIVGIKSLVTSEAIGYPRAVNKGAEVATGRFLLIVNNDIEFDPGIFADLIASFILTPNCGALGPRILSMDMTIQEIGSFVARDGSTGGYHRGERSAHQSGSLKSKVDYVSGCFLCLERGHFDELGRFDEAFSPGYYDEVDLCLRIVDTLGKDIVVDPALSICHYENASFMRGRPIAVSYPLILRNRQMLLRKHPKVSAQMAQTNRQSASDIGLNGDPRIRMLVIVSVIPGSHGACDDRDVEVLRGFHDLGISYDILAMNPDLKLDAYEHPDVAVYRAWMSSQSAEDVLGEVNHYSHIWVSGTHNLDRLAAPLKSYKDRHRATIICDANAIRAQQIIEMGRVRGQNFTENDVIDLVASELSWARIVDRFVAVREGDAAMIRRAGIAEVSVATHGICGPTASMARWEDRSRILMVAPLQSSTLSYFDSFSWFVERVMPKIEHVANKLTMAGRWDQDLLAEFIKSHPSVDLEFLGEVSGTAMTDLYAQSIVALAPTRFAAGMPRHVVEAMLSGTPVVMSDLLGEQVEITEHALTSVTVASVTDEGESFANAVTRLVSDCEYWTVVRDDQLAFATKNFSRENLIRQLVRVVRETGFTGQVLPLAEP